LSDRRPPRKGGNPNPHWLDRTENRQRTHFGRQPSRREAAREDLLRTWYGEDLGGREVVEHQRGAVAVGEVIPSVFQRFGIRFDPLLAELQEQWERLVGTDVARNCCPCQLQGRVLCVETADSTWRYVLETTHKQSILSTVQAFTQGRVTGLRFVPSGRRPRPRRPDRPSPPGPRS
jgi:hypothetical protein